MLINFLIGLAWLAIVLVPVIVAQIQPVVSHNGYLGNYMDPDGQEPTSAAPSDSSSSEA